MFFLRWIFSYVIRFGLAAFAILAGYHLTRRFGPGTAMAVAAGASLLASLLAMLLLRFSPLGRVNILNRIAGYLMPWGAKFGRGALWQFALGSGTIWVLLALIGVMLALAPAGTPTAALIALGIGWLIDGIAAAFIAGAIVQRRESLLSNANRSMLVILGVVLGVIGYSAANLYWGWPVLAAVIAIAPFVILGTPYLIFIGIIVAQGKNFRWH
jgi:hypothetical protein